MWYNTNMNRFEEQEYYTFFETIEKELDGIIETPKIKLHKKDLYDSICHLRERLNEKPRFVVNELIPTISTNNTNSNEFNVGDIVWVYERVCDDSIYGRIKGPIKIVQKIIVQEKAGERIEYYQLVENNRYCGPSRIIGTLFNSELAAIEKRRFDAHLFIKKEVDRFNSGKNVDVSSLRKLADSIGETITLERK